MARVPKTSTPEGGAGGRGAAMVRGPGRAYASPRKAARPKATNRLIVLLASSCDAARGFPSFPGGRRAGRTRWTLRPAPERGTGAAFDRRGTRGGRAAAQGSATPAPGRRGFGPRSARLL